jgi:enterochelin esterase-like enzyme
MNNSACRYALLTASLLAATAITDPAFAQAPAKTGAESIQQATFAVSPEVSPDRQLTFRLYAPKAENVRLNGPDLPGLGQGAAMTRDTNGLWEVTIGPINSGAYRYNFNVDGLSVIDPRNPATSESNENTWSLVYVPGADFMDTKDVPHGAVSEFTYYSTALKRFRRMHVYTPPGYESGKGKYPVFYLLHGAWDCDNSWTTVGRAGYILDNLIAAKKAKPMVVVMPAGHTGPFHAGMSFNDDFERDFVTDVMPLVESRYRVRNERKDRAIAGLSMGGGQTLNLGMANLDKFAYLGVFSSGVFSLGQNRRTNAPAGPSWEEKNKATLDDPKLKPGLKLVWFATGKEDFLLKTSQATVELLERHGFEVVYNETEGAHTWINWREYLNEFAPLLFQ